MEIRQILKNRLNHSPKTARIQSILIFPTSTEGYEKFEIEAVAEFKQSFFQLSIGARGEFGTREPAYSEYSPQASWRLSTTEFAVKIPKAIAGSSLKTFNIPEIRYWSYNNSIRMKIIVINHQDRSYDGHFIFELINSPSGGAKNRYGIEMKINRSTHVWNHRGELTALNSAVFPVTAS